jgi:sRNA-binding protein
MGRHCAGAAAATIVILAEATVAMPETLPPADDPAVTAPSGGAPTEPEASLPVEPQAAPQAEPLAATTEAGQAAEAVSAAPAPQAPAIPELSPAACGARLAALFPALFAQRAQPLKLRIQADIQQRAPGVFTRKTLSAFLHRHTTTNAYLMSLTQAPQRVDLDGAAAGEISEEHRQAAVQELARRRGLFEERRAAEQAARGAAENEARQAHAAQDQARRDRAALLRAVETSTLTRANFCALKGLTEADLEAQLVQARAEALQRAQEPRPQPRPEPRFDGRNGPRPGNAPRRGEPRR